jgi:hypothetical protein
MSKYGDMQQFPVKVQVPLLFTVYALLAFKKFRPITAADGIGPDFFEVPPGYRWALGCARAQACKPPAPHAALGGGRRQARTNPRMLPCRPSYSPVDPAAARTRLPPPPSCRRKDLEELIRGQMHKQAQLEAQLHQQDKEEAHGGAAAQGAPPGGTGRGLLSDERLAAELSPEELAALQEAQAELLRAAEEEEEQERLWMRQQEQQEQQGGNAEEAVEGPPQQRAAANGAAV